MMPGRATEYEITMLVSEQENTHAKWADNLVATAEMRVNVMAKGVGARGTELLIAVTAWAITSPYKSDHIWDVDV